MLAVSCGLLALRMVGRQKEVRSKQGSKEEPSWQVRGGLGHQLDLAQAGHHLGCLWGRVAAVTCWSHRKELSWLTTGSQIYNQINQVFE